MVISQKSLFLCVKITIELYCPNCQSTKIKRNGKKSYNRKQNYQCKSCGRQFIGNHALIYKGCLSSITQCVLLMLVRGIGIRDITLIKGISINKFLSVLVKSTHTITPQQSHYDYLEVDEFRTYVGNKGKYGWFMLIIAPQERLWASFVVNEM